MGNDSERTDIPIPGHEGDLGGLRTMGVIDYPSAGMVAATDLLFPAGLA